MRVYIGIYTWLATTVDDEADKDPEEWQHFVTRFYNREEQHNALARAWDDHLRLCQRHFFPKAANFIVTASLSFTNVNALAGCEVPKMARTTGVDGSTWSQYMREKEGIENERKNLARNGEKQSKLIEKVVEEKTNLSQQIVSGGFCDLIDFRMLN